MSLAPEHQEEEAGGGLPARRIAYAVLNDIFFQKRSMDEALAQSVGFGGLAGRDRGFVRVLVSIVLKRARQMDTVLEKLLREPVSELKPPQIINIFRLGIAQFSFLETPAHAVVNTTVELAAAEGIEHHKPLVNAVLRRLTREGFPQMDARDAGRENTPEWLWRQWMHDYGVETALDIAAANLLEAPVDFSTKGSPDQWAQALEAILLPTGSLRKESSGFVPELPGFAEGAWWIQNAAAAMPVKLLGEVRGKTVVDLCAAPGGKTAQMAAEGAQVIAVDRSAARIKKLEENLSRLKLTAEVVIADGATWKPKEPVDAVLVDAPCTTTGTIRHQPDVLWLKEIKDQEKMVALQKKLLLNAVSMLKPGGTLLYCTCSLQKDEGENQTTWLLGQVLPLKLAPIAKRELAGTAEMLTPRGEIRSLPSHWKDFNGIDGFYIARFART